MFYVVCFDIVDDRIRYRVVKVLKAYGYRVQKSVFECPGVTEEQFLKMRTAIEKLIDHLDDSVRYYYLNRSCLEKFEFDGIGEKPENRRFHVV